MNSSAGVPAETNVEAFHAVLVNKLLALERPQITAQMVELMQAPDFFAAFLAPLTRRSRRGAVRDGERSNLDHAQTPDASEERGVPPSAPSAPSVGNAESSSSSSSSGNNHPSLGILPIRQPAAIPAGESVVKVSVPATEALRRSYWVARLLRDDMEQDKLLASLYKDRALCTSLLAAFRHDSKAWIPHITMVLLGFLRTCPDTFFSILSSSAADCAVHFDAICAALHHPLVPELLQDMLCLPTPKPGQKLATFDAGLRKRFSVRLAERGVLKRLVMYVVDDCVPFELAEAAAEAFTQTLKRISSETYCIPMSNSFKTEVSWIVEKLFGLVQRATKAQQEAAKLGRVQSSENHRDVSFAELSSALDEAKVRLVQLPPTVAALVAVSTWVLPRTVEAPSNAQYQSFGGTVVTMTENQLNHATAPLMSTLIKNCDVLFEALLDLPGASPHQATTPTSVSEDCLANGVDDKVRDDNTNSADQVEFPCLTRHPGHITPRPFSLMRLNLVRLLFSMIKADIAAGGSLLERVPVKLWQRLSSWLVEYPHTNMYHNLFVNLFSLVLASDCEPALRAIIKRPKKKKKKKKGAVGFLSRIIRCYQTSSSNCSVRGHILKCLNLVRLKVLSLAPTSFLSVYVRDLQDWREFLPTLLARTKLEHGKSEFSVPKPQHMMLTMCKNPGDGSGGDEADGENIGLNSSLADSLGLGHLKPWRGDVSVEKSADDKAAIVEAKGER